MILTYLFLFIGLVCIAYFASLLIPHHWITFRKLTCIRPKRSCWTARFESANYVFKKVQATKFSPQVVTDKVPHVDFFQAFTNLNILKWCVLHRVLFFMTMNLTIRGVSGKMIDCHLSMLRYNYFKYINSINTYRVAQKLHHFLYALTSSNINRFSQETHQEMR